MIIIDDICKKHKVLFFFPLGFEVDVDFSWRSFQLLLLCDASIRIDFLLILSGDKNDCPEYRRLIFFFHLFFSLVTGRVSWVEKKWSRTTAGVDIPFRCSLSKFQHNQRNYIYTYTHI